MKTHFFQHVPFEGPGSIETWLKRRKAAVTFTRFYEQPVFPEPADIDFLILLGGPMSVNDADSLAWLQQEREYVARFILTGKPLLGICLGAQMIASVLGCRVYRNSEREIGWFPVRRTPECPGDFFEEGEFVFHWHGETFDLPEGAIRLAETRACLNQAFHYGKNVYGFQFHMEVTPKSADALILNCGNELTDGRFIQKPDQIRELTALHFEKANERMERILEAVVRCR